MKFKPEEPFQMFDVGYVYQNVITGKIHVTLSRNKEDSHSLSMTRARYRFCVHLGYILPSYIHVDFKDEDKTNDELDNLKEVNSGNSLVKHYSLKREHQPKEETYSCSECTTAFKIDHGMAEYRKKMSKSGDLYCSQACSLKARAKLRTLSEEEQLRIKQLRESGKTIEEVTELTGYGANTITKYQGDKIRLNTLSSEKIKKIEELCEQGLSDRKISALINVSRQVVAKYRK